MPFFVSCWFTGFEKAAERTYSESWNCGTCWFYRGNIKTFRYLSIDCLREAVSKYKSGLQSGKELGLCFSDSLTLFGGEMRLLFSWMLGAAMVLWCLRSGSTLMVQGGLGQPFSKHPHIPTPPLLPPSIRPTPAYHLAAVPATCCHPSSKCGCAREPLELAGLHCRETGCLPGPPDEPSLLAAHVP